MARVNGRRSHPADSDDEEDSRANTPLSTAPNDRKRYRPSEEPEDTQATPSSNTLSSIAYSRAQNPIQTENKWALQPKRKHQPGAIVRVKLTNFVTYTSAEFFPGPNLNMVIGPNGTGKSTLVCAICLGLGWPPILLQRGKEAANFVKNGTQEAIIEIELQRATHGGFKASSNPVIRRSIKKDGNQSKFWLDGKPASNKSVLELARGYNIQVDNLCQFLPQDRVVEFAGLNTVELLQTTLKAAADPEVLEYHEELKRLRAEQQGHISQSKGERESLDNLQKRQQAQESEVQRLRDRIEIQKHVDQLIRCRPLPKYIYAKARANELKATKLKLSAETAQLKEQSEPALRKVNAKQQYAKAASRNRDDQKKAVKRAEDECSRINNIIRRYDEKMKDCSLQTEAVKKGAVKDKQEYSRRQTDLRTLEARKDMPPEDFDARSMNERIAQYKSTIRELVQKRDDLQVQYTDNINRGKELQNKKTAAENRLNELDTLEGQRMGRLEQKEKDTVQAWTWIKENMGLFKEEIFGPPAVTCSVSNPGMADAIESLLSGSAMRIITCSNQDDFALLQQKLTREKGLHTLSFRLITKDDPSSFRPPMPEEQLQSLGFNSWAIDCIEGPPKVLAMLCQESRLHQTAVATADVTDAQFDAIGRTQMSTYICNNMIHKIHRRAEYGPGAVSKQASNIRKATYWSAQSADLDRKARLTQELKGIKSELSLIVAAREDLKSEAAKLSAEQQEEDVACKDLQKEKERQQKLHTEYNGLDTKIAQVNERLESLKATLDSGRSQLEEIFKERDKTMLAKADSVLEYCAATHALRDASVQLLEAEVMAIAAQSDCESLQELNKERLATLRRKEHELGEAIKELEVAMEKGKAIAKDLKRLNSEAEALQDQGDSSLKDLVSELAEGGNITEAQLEDLVEAENAKLELTGGGIDAANTIREFEERAKRIAKLQDQLASSNEEQAALHEHISTIREYFEPSANEIVGQIDVAFAESFRRIGCAGQVELFRASSENPVDCTEELGGRENGLDFANWAIHISVKFRESEPLTLLDSHRQSGGERAVSTIFYLMAMQSLSKAPFRVVDEINQGMDQRNERMVHGRMVDIATANEQAVAEGKAMGSQYFLITPKLLTGLRYEKGMTVLCIVSGENMPSATDLVKRGEIVEKGRKIDFVEYAKRARRLGLGGERGGALGGRRIDSGVGMRLGSVEA